MAHAVDDRAVRRLTADEVMCMERLGVLEDIDRLELLDGVLVEKAVKNPPHEMVKERLVTWSAPAVAEHRVRLRIEAPIHVPDRTSLPEPDLAILAPGDDRPHPSTALLVVEVADTSLNIDWAVKPLLYSAAEVSEYWVVDVKARRVIVFTEPHPRGYRSRRTAEPPEKLAPGSVDLEPMDLATLFAGL